MGSRAQAWMVISSVWTTTLMVAQCLAILQTLGTEANPHEEQGLGMVRELSGKRARYVSLRTSVLIPIAHVKVEAIVSACNGSTPMVR